MQVDTMRACAATLMKMSGEEWRLYKSTGRWEHYGMSFTLEKRAKALHSRIYRARKKGMNDGTKAIQHDA